jgi:hypothetical protein
MADTEILEATSCIHADAPSAYASQGQGKLGQGIARLFTHGSALLR